MNDLVECLPLCVTDFNRAYTIWKKAGLVLADYARERYEFSMILERNPEICLAAHVNGIMVGCILGAFNGKRAWIYHLAVLPEHQGKNVGSLLVQQVETELRHKGVTKLLLSVAVTNLKVVPFYERQGYSVMPNSILLEKDIYSGQSIVKGGEMYANSN